MDKKRFTFDDEKEEQIFESQIDKFKNYQLQEDLIPCQPKQVQKNETTDNQKKFVVPKEKQTLQKRNSKRKSKTKIKKKIKRKNKKRIKVIKKKRKRSWLSTLFLFLLSLLIILGTCVGGYIAYNYYLKQQEQIQNLEKQVQEKEQENTSTPDQPSSSVIPNQDNQDSKIPIESGEGTQQPQSPINE